MSVRVLIADDHEIVRCGVRALVESQPGYEVCGEAATGRQAVEETVRLRPDIAVLDIGLPDGNGLEATRAIRARAPDTAVLILTLHAGPHVAREVVRAGARGYVTKAEAGRRLVTALEHLRAGRSCLPEGMGGRERGLTRRELEVVRLVARGCTSQEIARELGISVRTVESHRANAMQRLDVHSTAALVRQVICLYEFNPLYDLNLRLMDT